jgi:hypothetical protein
MHFEVGWRAHFEQDSRYYARPVFAGCTMEETALVGLVSDVPENGAEGGAAVFQDLGVQFHKRLARRSLVKIRRGGPLVDTSVLPLAYRAYRLHVWFSCGRHIRCSCNVLTWPSSRGYSPPF